MKNVLFLFLCTSCIALSSCKKETIHTESDQTNTGLGAFDKKDCKAPRPVAINILPTIPIGPNGIIVEIEVFYDRYYNNSSITATFLTFLGETVTVSEPAVQNPNNKVIIRTSFKTDQDPAMLTSINGVRTICTIPFIGDFPYNL